MLGTDAELLTALREEVGEGVDRLGQLVHTLRSAPEAGNADAVAAAFRIVHNIKGAARGVGVTDVEAVAHALEDALDHSRASGTRPSDRILDQVLVGITVIQQVLEGQDLSAHAAALVKELAQLRGAPEPAWPVAAAEHAAGPAVAASPDAAADTVSTTSVRVAVERLDRLMAHTADLLSVQARMNARTTLLNSVSAALGHLRTSLPPESRAAVAAVARQVDEVLQLQRRESLQFQHLTVGYSAAIKRVCMLPLGNAAPQWRRLVRECTQELGKPAELDVEVGDIEIDKHILDSLRDPMTHLLRNAVDHGVETPAARVAAGKPPVARILVRASMRGTTVELDISDDGAGFNVARIRDKAVAKGVITADVAAHLSDEDVLDLVFGADFSTADTVSRWSGRGVGLDVVRRRLAELGGRAWIAPRATLGGATVRLTIPSSQVSTRGLLVCSGDAVIAIPVDSILRTLRVDPTQIQEIDGAFAVRQAGGNPLRIRWLASLMGTQRQAQSKMLRVVVLGRNNARLGLVVDEVLGEEEFVTKRLPWNLEHVAGVSGAVLLGDGRLAVVLDPAFALAAQFRDAQVHETLTRAHEELRTRRVLVVDDSLTSRTLERNILASAGYEVDVAVDGEQAWERLQESPADLVVTDVDMPRLTGLELTRRIRANPKLGKTPIILVTSLDRPDDLARGVEAGADEYIVKGRFDQRKLLEAVVRLMAE